MSPPPNPELSPGTTRSIASRRCSESDVREKTVNFDSPIPPTPPAKIAETYLTNGYAGPGSHIPVPSRVPSPKLVHVDNDTRKVLNIMLQKHLAEQYNSKKAAHVAQIVFNILPATEDNISGEELEPYDIVGLEDFKDLTKHMALVLAVTAAVVGQSASPSGKQKRKMKTEDAKKDPQQIEDDKKDAYHNRLDIHYWECVSSLPTHHQRERN